MERPGLFLSEQDIHAAVPPRAVTSREREQWPNPGGTKREGEGCYKKIHRTSQASEGSRCWLQQRSVQISINLASTLWCLISVTLLSEPCHEEQEPRTRTRIVIVISNVNHIMCCLLCRGAGEISIILYVWSCSAQSCSDRFVKSCSDPLREWKQEHKEKECGVC